MMLHEFCDGDVVEVEGRPGCIIERADLHAMAGGMPGELPDKILVRLYFGPTEQDRLFAGSAEAVASSAYIPGRSLN